MKLHKSIEKCSWICVLGIAIAALVAIILIASPSHQWQPNRVTEAPYGNDFLQEWIGGYLILQGNGAKLYDTATFEAFQHDPRIIGFEWSRATYFPPVYPPPHYFVSTCLAWIPYRYAVVVWMWLLGIGLFLGCAITARYLMEFQSIESSDRSTRLFEGWGWIAIVLFPATVYALIVGQKGTLWMFLIAITWALLRKRRDGWAGIVFGILSLKPTLFFILPLVMARYGRWRFLAGTAVSVVVLWGVAFIALPGNVWIGFAEKMAMSATYAGIQGYHLDWSCNLMSLAYVAQAPEGIELLKWLLVLPLALYGLIAILEPRGFNVDEPSRLWNILIVTFLMSPHSYYYDLVVLLVPMLWFAKTDARRGFAYYLFISTSIVVSPWALKAIGIPLIPLVLIAAMIEQRLSQVAISRRFGGRPAPVQATLP